MPLPYVNPKDVIKSEDWNYMADVSNDIPIDQTKNRTKDTQINDISIEQNRIVISKDLDFVESLLVSDKPYKLIYVAVGNVSNKELLEIFGKNIDKIVKCIEDSRLIEITKSKIIVKN